MKLRSSSIPLALVAAKMLSSAPNLSAADAALPPREPEKTLPAAARSAEKPTSALEQSPPAINTTGVVIYSAIGLASLAFSARRWPKGGRIVDSTVGVIDRELTDPDAKRVLKERVSQRGVGVKDCLVVHAAAERIAGRQLEMPSMLGRAKALVGVGLVGASAMVSAAVALTVPEYGPAAAAIPFFSGILVSLSGAFWIGRRAQAARLVEEVYAESGAPGGRERRSYQSRD